MKKALLILLMAAFLGQSGYIVNQELSSPKFAQISTTMDIVNGRTAYIVLDHIDDTTWAGLRQDLLYVQTMGIKDVHLSMTNSGGSIPSMFAIYDVLHDMTMTGKIRLTTHAQGLVGSAAVAVYLLGEVRTIGQNGILMIHSHSGKQSAYQSDSLNKTLNHWTTRMVDIYEDRTDMTRDNIETYVKPNGDQRMEALFMTAEEALDYGFATQII